MLNKLPTAIVAHVLQWCSVRDWARWMSQYKQAYQVIDYLRIHATHVYFETASCFKEYLFFSTNRMGGVPPIQSIVSNNFEYSLFFVCRHRQTLRHCSVSARQLEILGSCPNLTRLHVGVDALDTKTSIEPLSDVYRMACFNPQLERLDLCMMLTSVHFDDLFGPLSSVSSSSSSSSSSNSSDGHRRFENLTHLTLLRLRVNTFHRLDLLHSALQHCPLKHLSLSFEIDDSNRFPSMEQLSTFIQHHVHRLEYLKLVFYYNSPVKNFHYHTLKLGTLPRLIFMHTSIHYQDDPRSSMHSDMTINLQCTTTSLEVLELSNIQLDIYTEPPHSWQCLREAHVQTRNWSSIAKFDGHFPRLRRLIIDNYFPTWYLHLQGETMDNLINLHRLCEKYLFFWLRNLHRNAKQLELLIVTGIADDASMSDWQNIRHSSVRLKDKNVILRGVSCNGDDTKRDHKNTTRRFAQGLTLDERQLFGLRADCSVMQLPLAKDHPVPRLTQTRYYEPLNCKRILHIPTKMDRLDKAVMILFTAIILVLIAMWMM